MVKISEFLKFVKWEGEFALFQKASIFDRVLVGSGMSSLCYVLGIKEGQVLLIQVPEIIMEEKGDENEHKTNT